MKLILAALPLAMSLVIAAPRVHAADLKAAEAKVEAKVSDIKGPDLKTRIDAANQLWVAAFNRGDAAALAGLYTDQATVLPPGGDMVTGHDNLVKLWQGAIQSGMKVKSLTTVSLERHGGIVREIGRVSVEVPGADKVMQPLEGKYVVVWKEVKGAWKLDTDIWNLNK